MKMIGINNASCLFLLPSTDITIISVLYQNPTSRMKKQTKDVALRYFSSMKDDKCKEKNEYLIKIKK